MKTQFALAAILVLGIALFGCVASGQTSGTPTPGAPTYAPTSNTGGYQTTASPDAMESANQDANDLAVGDVSSSDFN